MCFFLIMIFLFLEVPILQSAEITLSPVSRNVTLNSTVQFTCQGLGDWITFYVDGKFASTPTIMNRGFELMSPSTENGTLIRSLLATAYEGNNNTNISCAIFPSSPIVTSPPAVLLIQGILGGVGDLMAAVVDGSNVSLTWTPPYSLDNVPITGYNIITSDGINITVNTPYHILTSSDPDPCNITTVSVGAFGGIPGRYTNVSFFFSQVPHEIYITRVAPLVLVDQVLLEISFHLSDLCIGERPTNITIDVIYSDSTDYIINSTDISMISRDQLTVDQTITIPNITDWRMFIINITLFNVAGERSYSIPLVRLGPVNNITSFLINYSTINISWERPSVSDIFNIHNYTLLIYRDTKLIHNVTVKGSTTSYHFTVNDLFNHEYTYVIYGSNELGEGDHSNGTFSYSDIDECSINNGGCNQVCINQVGSYYCQCNDGFQLSSDNHICQDINECSIYNGGCEQECTNTNGSYQCSCYAGYSGGQFCTDINECVLGISGCAQECVNINGSYECTCQDGYYIDIDNHTCLDINECTVELTPCHQRCVNDNGSFHCDCNTGYILSGNGIICEDVNECESRNGGCEQNCTNTPGNFYCSCNNGYLLYNDVFCSDFNECLNGNNSCSQNCTNTIGGYECTCSDGYYLGSNGHTCLDVDECSENNGNCQQKCVNEIGSFYCECDQPGYIQSKNESACILTTVDTNTMVYIFLATVSFMSTIFLLTILLGLIIRKKKRKTNNNVPPVQKDHELYDPTYDDDDIKKKLEFEN